VPCAGAIFNLKINLLQQDPAQCFAIAYPLRLASVPQLDKLAPALTGEY
jgi:hypothetical protein